MESALERQAALSSGDRNRMGFFPPHSVPWIKITSEQPPANF